MNHFIHFLRLEIENIEKNFQKTHQSFMEEISKNPAKEYYYHFALENNIKKEVEELISITRI